MKKRLSKLALLAVAAAFVLVGFPACGDDDNEEPPAPATATLTSTDIPEDGLALTAGKSQGISATVTVTNTTFTDVVTGLAAGTDISEYITLTAGEKVNATAKLAEAVTGNTMKLTITVTADADAEADSIGEIKVTLKAPAVTAYKDLDVTEAISYTVKAAEDDKREEKTPAATLTGNGVNLTSSEAKTVTAIVTLTDATFADSIEAANFTAKAGNGVTITVTAAERTSDTEATLTLSMTAEANAADGTVSVIVKADALAGHDADLNATGTIGYTVSEPGELTAALACEIGELTADEAKEVPATVTLTNGTFAGTIAPANFTAKAGDKVTVTVTKAEKKSDTEATLTLSVKAAEGAQNGTVSVTIKAAALANSEKDLNTPPVTYTVKQQPKPEDAVATLTGEIGELTAGKAKEVSATVTLTKGAYSDAVKALAADADISGYITLTAGDKATVTAKLAEKVTGSTMKITLTVTAGNAEGNGTITATLKAAAVTANKNTEATGEISYTVKAAGTGSGEENPPETKTPTAKLTGEAITVTAGETTTATATVTLTDGTFAETIAAANFAANASNDKVTAEVTKAEKKSDTVATLTLSMTAADGATAGDGTVSVTVNADAVKDYDKAISATGTLTYTVKEAAPVYFTSFVASELGEANITTIPLISADGLVKAETKAEYQINQQLTTNDYNEETGTGYSYTARVRIGKNGTLTITNVNVGNILRFDGGSVTSGSTRTMEITGADEAKWESTVYGSFYLKATTDTVVLKSITDNFAIYGIHVVDEKVAEKAVGEPVMTYEKPTLTLSAPSVAQGGEVTVTATIPQATKTTTYSTGRVESEKFDVNAEITYVGAGVTVTDGKVDTSTQGTLMITASYTVDDQTYTSEEVTLEVTKSFETKEAQIANDDGTLGLTATEVTSADEAIATAALSGNNIVITSIAQGETVITVSDGTKTAKIDVTVKASGEIKTTVHKYASSVTVAYDATEKQFNDTTIVLGDGSHNNTKVSATYDGVTYTAGYKMESSSKITLTLSAKADIYFVAAGDKTLKIDSKTAWAVNTLIENVEAGMYALTNGTGSNQTSVCAVVITYK